jgi:hypothetical protein
MSHPKRGLQDAEETLGFRMQLLEVNGFGHKRIGSRLKDAVLVFAIAADRDNDGSIVGVCLDAAADFDPIDPGNHDVKDHQVRFRPADFDQSSDAVGSGRYLIPSLPLEEYFHNVDDLLLVVDNQNTKFPFNKRFRRGNLMFAKKSEEVIPADPSVSTGRPVGRQQTLFDPIDDRPWVYMKKVTDLMCRVDTFGILALIDHYHKIPSLSRIGCRTRFPYSFLHFRRLRVISTYGEIGNGNKNKYKKVDA